ncbi:MAG: HAD-IIIC family phosphatase [Thermoactinospora sp.]|nr:HAD-IIIC family phosphatase [Thermoactinospora sp.]
MDTDDLLDRLSAGAAADPALLAALDRLLDLGEVPALVEAGLRLADVPGALLPDPVRPLRVAMAATFTAEAVPPLLRVLLLRAGLAPDLYVCPFGQAETQLADPGSDLAAFRPDVTLLLLHDEALLPDDPEPATLGDALATRLAALRGAVDAFASRTHGSVLLHTVPLSRAEQRAVISYRDRAALGRLWRRLNCELLELGERPGPIHVVDLESLLTGHPGDLRDDRLHAFAGMAWSPGVELLYAREAATFCRAVAGLSRKVLVLDLDDTLWGGVVGDDGLTGIELGPLYPGNAYLELQRRARSLRRQGVLLAVSSKNEPEIVDRVFAEHPGMLLRTGDFVARAVGWQPKSDQLRRLADSLGLGLDSFVFADDSRFECEQVRQALPGVAVAHLRGDPAGHAAALLGPDHFAVLATTEVDRDRTGLYRARFDRERAAASFASAEDHLRSLRIRVTVGEADDYTVPRLVQLASRTNQFVMVKGAHAESETRAYARSPGHLLLGFEVADRFGADGVVGGVWISRRPGHWLIENFVMSCRVFARGVEHAVLQHVIDRALADGSSRLEARLVPTAANRPGAAFYPSTGFTPAAGDRLTLSLSPRPALLPAWIDLKERTRAS